MSPRLSRLPLVVLSLLACIIYATTAQGKTDEPSAPKCDSLTWEDLAQKAQSALKTTQLSRAVLPGGARVEVALAVEWNANAVYCARLDHDIRAVAVVSARKKDDDGMTLLTLQLPKVSSDWYRFWGDHREILLVGFQPDAGGKWDTPHIGVKQTVMVTSPLPGFVGSIIVLVIAYALAAGTYWKMRGEISIDPVAITAGEAGRASLSKFQIFGFSLIVVYLLANFLLRYGMLTDLSPDILLLLGISAAGAAGSKVAGVAKKRLSFENWSWLQNEGWLPPVSRPQKAQWSDLLKTDDEFDVYSFQLASVSIVVALSLLTSDPTTLATFTIPGNLLGLLGLSNVVYVGGKAVAPSLNDLDDRVTAVRNALNDWLTAVAPDLVAAALADKLAVATTRAPAQYQAYVAAAREAARMLKSVFGPRSKFRSEPITDAELMPTLP